MTSAPSVDSEEVGEFYDRFTELFTELWGGNLHVGYWIDEHDDATFETAAEQLTDLLIRTLAPRPGQRVLDVGCGVGQPAVSLARVHDVEVVGVSISRNQVAQATRRAARARLGDRVRFDHADAAELPFDDASFDTAWAIESMLHMPDKRKVLSEMKRVVRPGGRVVIADMFSQPESKLTYQDLISTVEVDQYRDLVERSGLVDVEYTDITAHTLAPQAALDELRARLMARRDEVIRVTGQEEFDRLMGDMLAPPSYGYLLVTASRP